MLRWSVTLFFVVGCTEAPPAPAALPASDSGSDTSEPLEWGQCDLSQWPEGFPPPADGVLCASVEVPLDHDAANGEKIVLRVARQLAQVPSGRAVFQLAGGPGGSSVAQSGMIVERLPKLNASFDLVYVDQRGSGGSGYLGCDAGYPSTQAAWIACGEEHADDPLRHYLTLSAARDLELVRQRLGYERIHLRAGSYGTRLALEYVRQYPSSVQAAVLDGVDPPDVDFLGWLAQEFDSGIAWMVDACAADASCIDVSPSLQADLHTRRLELRQTPRPISVGGTPYVEDETTYLSALEACLYDAELFFRVPRAIHAAISGDDSPWNAILSELFAVPVESAPSTRGTSYVAPALWMTIVCAEALPSSGGIAALELLTSAQIWPSSRALDYARACAAWNVPPAPAELFAAVRSDARLLLLSGGLDLRTPPAWGEHALETLTNARHVVVPFAFHSTMSVPCAADIMTEFLQSDGDANALDPTCLDAIPSPVW